MKTNQATLFDFSNDSASSKRYGGKSSRTTHGGVFGKNGKHTGRKLERPISTKHALHIVLKSDKARGKLSFLTFQNSLSVKKIIKKQARKFGVILQDFANAGNHLHLKVRCKSRVGLQKFLKSTTALISRKITGARKGKPFGRFWLGLAFSRVLKTRKEEMVLKGYFEANRKEVSTTNRREGLRRRADYLEEFSEWVACMTRRRG